MYIKVFDDFYDKKKKIIVKIMRFKWAISFKLDGTRLI